MRFAEALTKLLAERRTAPSPPDSRGVGNPRGAPSPGGVLGGGSVSDEDAGAGDAIGGSVSDEDAGAGDAISELFEARAPRPPPKAEGPRPSCARRVTREAH